MTTVIFVHGTSVRKQSYERAIHAIRDGLDSALRGSGLPSVVVDDCLWGDSLGVRLNAGGRSVPEYTSTGGQGRSELADSQVLLWEMLSYDPLYELQGLALRPARGSPPFDIDAFKAAVQSAPSQALVGLLEAAGLSTGSFVDAQNRLVDEPVLDTALSRAAGAGECRLAVARCLVASAVLRQGTLPGLPASTDTRLRDELVQAIADAIGPADRGVVSWTGNLVYAMAQRLGGLGVRAALRAGALGGTPLVRRHRGVLTDQSSLFAGDILLYQARGGSIRDFIQRRIEEARPPVVLLGHSLGGIACVDLLVLEELNVELLVTVGSQAPLLYEMNALPSLKYGDPLPNTFVKRWVNIYDPRDFLSYQLCQDGRPVFPMAGEPGPRFVDHRVDNRLSFPDAHSGYWTNEAVWRIVSAELSVS